MRIKQLTLREVRIPLNFQFSQANNAGTTSSHSAIVEMTTTDDVVGYGEACPRLYVTGEDIASMQLDLQNITPRLKSQAINSVEDWIQFLNSLRIGNSTRCALELAGLDAFSKTTEQDWMKLFDLKPKETLSYSLILPLLEPSKLEKLIPRIATFHPLSIKLKVNNQLEETLKNIQLIRTQFGENIPIRVDVNGGWTKKEALRFIPKLMKVGITSFEQPLAIECLSEMKELMQRFGETAQLMLDESLLNVQQAEYILQHRLCNHFNLKISKLGGIFPSLAIYELAHRYNVPCQLGAHFGETSILTQAGILLSSMVVKLTAQEGAMGIYLLQKDIVTSSVQHNRNGQLQPMTYMQADLGWGNIEKSNLRSFSGKTLEFHTEKSILC